MTDHMVDALCLTRERPELLKRAVTMFLNQTLNPNLRHLTILKDPRGDRHWVDDFLKWLDGHPDVTFMEGESLSVGALRQELVERSEIGDIVVTWDDDDYYHPERLEEQYKAMVEQKKGCSNLVDCCFWFEDKKELVLASFEVGGVTASFMAWRDKIGKYPAYHPNAVSLGERGTDTVVCLPFVQKGDWAPVYDKAWLYVRSCRSDNITPMAQLERASRHSRWHERKILSHGPNVVKKLKEFFPRELPSQVPDFYSRPVKL